jgi:hypothetical protein
MVSEDERLRSNKIIRIINSLTSVSIAQTTHDVICL